MNIKIEAVKPRSHYRHYSNQECQGSIIRATAEWPMGDECVPAGMCEWNCYEFDSLLPKRKTKGRVAVVPDGLDVGSAYVDRMWGWDYAKMEKAFKLLSNSFDSPDEELLAFVREYFGVDVVSVRTVYYYNVSTGYPCERIDYIYRPEKKSKKS